MDEYIPLLKFISKYNECAKVRRGALIIDSEGNVISMGTIRNCPEAYEKCFNTKNYDCHSLHAEAHAISRARSIPSGSQIIHLKFDKEGEPVASTRSFCPSCIKLMHEQGIESLWLLHSDGWTQYLVEEAYNSLY